MAVWDWECFCGAIGTGKDYDEANKQYEAHDCPHTHEGRGTIPLCPKCPDALREAKRL